MGLQVNVLKATAAKERTALISAHNEKFHKHVDEIGSKHEKEVADLRRQYDKQRATFEKEKQIAIQNTIASATIDGRVSFK